MLIIRCKEGETIMVADDVRITVLAAGAGKVRLGIEAPPNVRITRKEFEDTRNANTAAAGANVEAFLAVWPARTSGVAAVSVTAEHQNHVSIDSARKANGKTAGIKLNFPDASLKS